MRIFKCSPYYVLCNNAITQDSQATTIANPDTTKICCECIVEQGYIKELEMKEAVQEETTKYSRKKSAENILL